MCTIMGKKRLSQADKAKAKAIEKLKKAAAKAKVKLKRADITAKEKLKIAESKSKKLQITKEQVQINKKIKRIDNKKNN